MKIGDKVIIKNIEDYPEYKGKEGFITAIRKDNSLLGTWGELAVLPHKDDIEVIKTKYSVTEEECQYKQYCFEFETEADAEAVYNQELDVVINMIQDSKTLSVMIKEEDLLHFARLVDEIIE